MMMTDKRSTWLFPRAPKKKRSKTPLAETKLMRRVSSLNPWLKPTIAAARSIIMRKIQLPSVCTNRRPAWVSMRIAVNPSSPRCLTSSEKTKTNKRLKIRKPWEATLTQTIVAPKPRVAVGKIFRFFPNTIKVAHFWTAVLKSSLCATTMNTSLTTIVKLAETIMEMKQKSQVILRSRKMRLKVATRQAPRTSNTQALCQCCSIVKYNSPCSLGRRDEDRRRKKRTKVIVARNSQARGHLSGRRKLSPIVSTLIEIFTPRACAKIVIISRAARNLLHAVPIRRCTQRNYAKIATWNTTARRKERKTGMLKQLPRL